MTSGASIASGGPASDSFLKRSPPSRRPGDAAAPSVSVVGAASPVDPEPPDPDDTWIEISLVGEDGAPISGERYAVITPDGQRHEGVLDDSGVVHLQSRRGTCQLTFLDLDADAWAPA